MKRFFNTQVFIGLAMLTTAESAVIMKPKDRIADHTPKVHLQTIISQHFGNWTLDQSIMPLEVNAQQQTLINKLYNQTLSRTYINPQGQRIMLLIAYGSDQSDTLQVHKPEICYVAQGFQVSQLTTSTLQTPYGSLPIKRLMAVQSLRNEPITYWIRIGNRTIKPSGLDQKLQQLRYGLTGKIPDGVLVRVSSLDSDAQQAYQLQNSFIQDMLAALNPKQREQLIGTATSH